jgi:hypothetical protein
MGFDQTRAEEAEVVLEDVGVGVGGGGGFFCAVAMAAEAGAVARSVADGLEARASLRDSRIERRVDVDELHRSVGERAQRGKIFGVEDAVHRGLRSSVAEVECNGWRLKRGERVFALIDFWLG